MFHLRAQEYVSCSSCFIASQEKIRQSHNKLAVHHWARYRLKCKKHRFPSLVSGRQPLPPRMGGRRNPWLSAEFPLLAETATRVHHPVSSETGFSAHEASAQTPQPVTQSIPRSSSTLGSPIFGPCSSLRPYSTGLSVGCRRDPAGKRCFSAIPSSAAARATRTTSLMSRRGVDACPAVWHCNRLAKSQAQAMIIRVECRGAHCMLGRVARGSLELS